MEGDTTDWYTSYWAFMSKYCTSRFGDSWSLTAEQSLDLHSGNTTVPRCHTVAAGSSECQAGCHRDR